MTHHCTQSSQMALPMVSTPLALPSDFLSPIIFQTYSTDHAGGLWCPVHSLPLTAASGLTGGPSPAASHSHTEATFAYHLLPRSFHHNHFFPFAAPLTAVCPNLLHRSPWGSSRLGVRISLSSCPNLMRSAVSPRAQDAIM